MTIINKEFDRALDYIYSFVDFSKTRNLRYSPENFDLSRMEKLVELMGNPQLQYPVIHVAGTKGKGSTCAMIASVLSNAGYKTGFYSSPHLVDFRERIKINNRCISKEEWITYVDEYKEIIERVEKVSTFEIVTALSFQYFADNKIDIGVIEVGMGGRLDATNVVDPLLSVITHISIDHTKILGDTVEKIAREKAGIIKQNRPVVVSRQEENAFTEISKIAEMKESELLDVSSLFSYKIKSKNLHGQYLQVTDELKKNKKVYFLPLIGDHQAENLLTALAAIQAIGNTGYSIPEVAVTEGIKSVIWPGRFEILSENPLLIIDCAHNPDSFVKLCTTIETYLGGKKIHMIFGVSEDKDYLKMLEIAKPFVESWTFTQSTHPRALCTAELEIAAKKVNLANYQIQDIKSTISDLLKKNISGTVLLASGSMFIAAAVKEIIEGSDSNC